ncbi:MAG: DUF4366 domain-containing protein [Eubacterium sp.]|nr:DUF4366 domain-containing protein [Eubacterium sp.]MDY5496769.1 DUF4366 domain-containing protein [Anaerobutyricum sp.]
MKNMDELLSVAKLSELLNKKKEDGESRKVLWALAIIGAIAAVAGIAALVYKYLSPDYLEEIDEDFDDDFDDDFFDDEEEPEKEEEPAAPEAKAEVKEEAVAEEKETAPEE